jgi:hypothetical protein
VVENETIAALSQVERMERASLLFDLESSLACRRCGIVGGTLEDVD